MSDLTLKQVCEQLGISYATGTNWIRLGKLVPAAYTGRNPRFTQQQVGSLLREIRDSGTLLKRRRNKRQYTGHRLYRAYLKEERLNTEVIRSLLQRDEIWEERLIPLVLSEYALQLLSQAYGADAVSPPLLPSFLSGGFSIGRCDRLVRDLLGPQEFFRDDLEEARQALSHTVRYSSGQDFLGFAYMSLGSLHRRKAEGAYYTPAGLVDEMVEELLAGNPQGGILDPCCGTGSFLLGIALREGGLDRVYGQDKDHLAVAVARINLALAVKPQRMEDLYSHVVVGDSLRSFPSQEMGAVIGNPPWGMEIQSGERESLAREYRTAAGRTVESSSLFLECALKRLPSGGRIAYVLPQALLQVKAHTAIRRILQEQAQVTRVDYLGDIFDGVQCPAIALHLTKTPEDLMAPGMQVRAGGRRFQLATGRRLSAEEGFHFNTTDGEYECLWHMETQGSAVKLEGNADFALGIVTGDNSRFLHSTYAEGREPVFKGSDLRKYRPGKPGQYLCFTPAEFQQVASPALYRAPEKLLYRFVGESLVFAYDNAQRLSLNSCNLLIPRLPGIKIRYLLAVLNSRAVQFYWMKRFHSLKLLRSHIEQIPIPLAEEGEQMRVEELVEGLLTGAGDPEALYERLDEQVMNLYRLDEEKRRLIRRELHGRKLYLPG